MDAASKSFWKAMTNQLIQHKICLRPLAPLVATSRTLLFVPASSLDAVQAVKAVAVATDERHGLEEDVHADHTGEELCIVIETFQLFRRLVTCDGSGYS